MRGPRLRSCGHVDSDDQVTAVEHRVSLGRSARQTVKLHERNRPLSRGPAHDHLRVERSEGDREIGGVCGDARVGPTEDGVVAVEPVHCRAAGAGLPLIARQGVLIAKIGAARALHDIAANRGHIAELTRCCQEKGFGDDREPIPDLAISRHIAHAGEGTNAKAAVRPRFNARQVGKSVYVQETLGKGHPILDQPDKVGTARDERELRVASVGRDGFLRIISP